MTHKIKSSIKAKETFNQNLEYLKNNFPNKVALSFIDRVGDVLFILKRTPYVFPNRNTTSNIRKVLIVKQITLFYSVEGNEIHLHLFWNNYKKPSDLKKFLNE